MFALLSSLPTKWGAWGAGMAQWLEHLPPTNAMWPGFDSWIDVICGLSLLLVLVLAPEGFFSGFSGFPPSTKTNISKFQFDLESEGHRFVSRQTVKCHPH